MSLFCRVSFSTLVCKNCVHYLFSDTHSLALLIDERDEILENLEIAETRYIGSFRVTTPDPSVADFQANLQMDTDRPYISRPLPLGQNAARVRIVVYFDNSQLT